ncbi:MAG: hypothetical protein JF606_16360 [Burkholderiales bacterium]|nr:hypothetical protein [Burkholderiales bacterium]
MRSHPHIFAWDEEPAEERPSEFTHTTGYSVLSGYHVPSELNARVARRRSGSGFGFKGLVIAIVVFLGLSAVAIHELAKLLRS